MPMLHLRTLGFDDLEVGMVASLGKTVTEQDIFGFAEISGDNNPIHINEKYAAETRFGCRIAHGMLTASYVSAVIGTRLPGMGAIYLSQTLNFRAPVMIGDRVITTVRVAELIQEKMRAKLHCECKVGDKIVLDGEAVVMLPKVKSDVPAS